MAEAVICQTLKAEAQVHFQAIRMVFLVSMVALG
jgi:hypothetical protein